MQKEEYKITLLGEKKLGKTLFLKRLYYNSNNLDITDYTPTLGVEVTPIEINDIRLNVWDCAGDDRYRGLKAGYHIDTKCAIIFRKSNSNIHLDFINELPENTPIFYIDDYNLENPEYTIDQYKNMLYNFLYN